MSNEPNNTSLAFLTLGKILIERQEQFAKLSEPHIKEWLSLQVRLGKIDAVDANRGGFEFCGFDNDDSPSAVLYESEDWEEYWAYGGYEKHYGQTLAIPLDFFDNPQPYRDEADQYEADRTTFIRQQAEKDKRNRVANLERQLAKARAELVD